MDPNAEISNSNITPIKPSQTPPMNQIEETKRVSRLFVFAISLFLAILIPTGIFLYSKNQTQIKPTPLPVITPTPKPTPTPDPTANWKTYDDSQYSYSFKYPSDANLKVTDNNLLASVFGNPVKSIDVFLDEGKNSYRFYTISIYPSQNETSIESWIRKYQADGESLTLKNTTLGGTQAESVENLVGGVFNRQGVFALHGNYIYSVVSSSGAKQDTKEYNQILSTFTFAPLSTSKFTNQNSVDNSAWKDGVFNNLNFKYPAIYNGGYVCDKTELFFIDTLPIPKSCSFGDDTPGFDFRILRNQTLEQAKQSFLNRSDLIDKSTSNITVDNHDALKTKGILPPGEDVKNHNDWNTYISYGKDLYVFRSFDLHISNTDQQKYFDQIISTLKFTQ